VIGKKLVETESSVEFVPIPGLEEPGVWIRGRPHVLLLPGELEVEGNRRDGRGVGDPTSTQGAELDSESYLGNSLTSSRQGA
jgi:hypothetical protein